MLAEVPVALPEATAACPRAGCEFPLGLVTLTFAAPPMLEPLEVDEGRGRRGRSSHSEIERGRRGRCGDGVGACVACISIRGTKIERPSQAALECEVEVFLPAVR